MISRKIWVAEKFFNLHTACCYSVVLFVSYLPHLVFPFPFQFLISVILTDLIMSMIVMPIHMYDRFTNFTTILSNVTKQEGALETQSITNETSVSGISCKVQLFSHLISISIRGWSLALFVLLHHLHDSIIPSKHSILGLTGVWIASGVIALPAILINDSLVDFESCSLVSRNYGKWQIFFVNLELRLYFRIGYFDSATFFFLKKKGFFF